MAGPVEHVATDRGMLSERTVAISVSDTRDLLRLGMLERDLQRVLAELVTMLVYRRARIAYGGDLRAGGLTQRMFKEVVAAYALGNVDKRIATFVHYAAFPTWREWSARELFEHVSALEMTGEVRLFLADGSYYALIGDEGGITVRGERPDEMRASDVVTTPEELEPLWRRNARLRFRKETLLRRVFDRIRRSARSRQTADGLSAMRETMAREADARIVIGGRVAGYSGNAPGIAEEALKTLQHGKLLIPVAAYGGCASFVAHALGLFDERDLLKQSEVGRNFHETIEKIGALGAHYLDDLATRGIEKETLAEVSGVDTPARVAELCTAVLVKALGHAGS